MPLKASEQCRHAETLERSGEKPSNAFGSGECVGLNSITTPRNARESRYSRDEEALYASLSRCSDEPSVERLQAVALEKVRKELETRVQDYEHQRLDVRTRFATEDAVGEGSRESLLRQRLLIEHWLAVAQEEVTAITQELGRLKDGLQSSTAHSVNFSRTHEESTARMSANLTLFFENSVTRRPFPRSLRPRSADFIRDTRLRQSGRFADRFDGSQTMARSRSRSMIENHHVDNARRSEPSLSPSGPEMLCIEQLSPTPQRVPAVDEFSNSFTSRVIAPSRSHSRPRSVLRPLHTPSKERRSRFSYPRRTSARNVDYGTMTLLPHALPRSKSQLLDDLPDAPLPSYVQSLIDDFEKVFAPSGSLHLTGRRVPTLQKGTSLSPVLEQSLSSIKSQLTSKTRSPAKSAGRKLVRNPRSIFTLRLPFSGSSSHSTLAASSSTSVTDSMNEHSSDVPVVESIVPLRSKGLPSTRDHDLAMLDGAFDDIPDSPIPDVGETEIVAKSRVSRSFAVLRRVRSRLGLKVRH